MKIEQLKAFLRSHLAGLHAEDYGPIDDFEFPDFELTAFDYLDFAERSLAGSAVSDRINCIAHLKRATECQLDTLLHVMNAHPSKKRMSFPRKLETIQPFGILSPRALAKLNRIRNELEHKYATPDVANLEIYFELVSAFVHAIEGFILMLKTYGDIAWYSPNGGMDPSLHAKYSRQGPTLSFVCRLDENQETTLEFSPAEDGWGNAVRIFFLLGRHVGLVSTEFVLDRLDTAPVPLPSRSDVNGDV